MTNSTIALFIIDIMALLFLFGVLHGEKTLDNRRKKAFASGMLITVVIIIAQIGTILTADGSPWLRTFNNMFNVLGFLLSPVIPIILLSIFDTNIIKRHKLLLVPTIINAVAVLLSPIFGFIFYIDKFNVYSRGDLFYIFVIAYIINIMLLVLTTWLNTVKYFHPIKWKITSLTTFAVVGTCVQLLYPTVYSTWHVVTLSLFLLYMIISEFEGSFDALTRIYNRQAFEKASRQFSDKNMFSVILLDINDFKGVNDTYGHDYGDVVLKLVASSMREAFDNRCSFYRIGGDEFCIIRKDNNKEKLEEQINNMAVIFGKKRKDNRSLPTIAYGYCIKQTHVATNFEKIFKEADEKMYYHKESQKKEKELTQSN